MILKEKYKKTDMVKLAFLVSPFYSGLFAVQKLLNAIIPTITIFVTAVFLNTAMGIVKKTAEIQDIYLPITFLTLIVVYQIVIESIMGFIKCRAGICYRKRLQPLMLERCACLEYRFIEDSETKDLISRVCPVFHSAVLEMYLKVLEAVDSIIYVFGILTALFIQAWYVALILIAAGIPILIIAGKAGRSSYEADKEMSKTDRKAAYFSDVLKSREAVEERCVFGYADQINQKYGECYNISRRFKLRVLFSNFIKSKLGGVVCSFISVATMLALLPMVVKGKMDIGMFIALTSAVLGLTSRLSWGINGLVEELSGKYEYLKDLEKFCSLTGQPDAVCLPDENVEFKKLEFCNVSFKYPGTETWILKDVSFVIEKGKRYSFVGANGAGKTTITKLITGLYTDYIVEILLNGSSLKKISQGQIKALTSVVYQDFARYPLSVYENIAVSDLYHCTREKVIRIIERVGLKEMVNRLHDGLETPLGQVLEKGVDISGGEWQRLALARCICSPAPLKILDEPTAALDPLGESMVYQDFEKISEGFTTIFISHRLGSTKLADIIFVLSDGNIAEEGTHRQLLSKNGIYADMYRSQASWYSDFPHAYGGDL